MHLTVWVSMIPSVGVERRPAARRRRTATSRISRSNRPRSSQRRNQPYTVRHGGRCDGKARQGPPTRRCQTIARTTASVGVAASLRGGSAWSSQRATFFSAHCDTISFRRGSCRARCSFVHIHSHRRIRRTSSSITENEMGIEEHNCTQTGSKSLFGWIAAQIPVQPHKCSTFGLRGVAVRMHWSTAADQPKSYESCLTVVTLIEGCPRKRNSAKQALS